MSAADLREGVARAIKNEIDPLCTDRAFVKKYPLAARHRFNDAMALSQFYTDAALRAVADAGFVIVPKRAMDLAVSRGCDHCADSIREARSALSAALKEMG